MDETKPITQSFIVRVWVEDRTEEGCKGTWRGQITHVSSNKHRYLTNLEEIADFISPYLKEMGVKPGMRWRMRCWLKRLTGRG